MHPIVRLTATNDIKNPQNSLNISTISFSSSNIQIFYFTRVMILNSTQVKQLAYNAGFRNINLDAAVKIAYCESGFNAGINAYGSEDSRGLWQIHYPAHPEYHHLDLYDPQINANVAYDIFVKAGKNFSDWTCARQLNLVNPTEIYLGIGLAFIGIALYISVAQ